MTDMLARAQSCEQLVARHARCPGCKSSSKTFRLLPPTFKCADLICDFCGYLAQVKSKLVKGPLPDRCPNRIMGSHWAPQRDRMAAGIYFSLYLVLVSDSGEAGIYFLPRDLQTEEMFVPRNPRNSRGFVIHMDKALTPAVRLPASPKLKVAK